MRINEIAAYTHKRMCEDNRFGYSWEERYGAKEETWRIDGKDYSIRVGDYDCSSSTITAWKIALQHTKYADALEGATYTGNMYSVFVNSGLFEWKPMSFLADTGDLYLNHSNHVAMCQTQYPDVLSEFSWGDNGAYGNKRGDQSGQEASVHEYYDYPWNGILHYNGKADSPDSKSVRLFGIDVSSNQPKRIVRDVYNDFAIVKLTGNPHGYAWNYVNPYAKQQVADARAKHGRFAVYHFTYGIDPKIEADFFISQVKKLGCLGDAMLVIDYEAQALNNGRLWVKSLADRVYELAGYKPVIYASGSVVISQQLFSLGYPIWCANYSKGYQAISGYNTAGCSIYQGCEKSVLWQFTSQGHLAGYDGPLDLDEFFGKSWENYTNKASSGKWKSGTYVTIVKGVKVRTQRSVNFKAIATLPKGTALKIVTIGPNKYGNIWGRIDEGKYKGKYVCIKYGKQERMKLRS